MANATTYLDAGDTISGSMGTVYYTDKDGNRNTGMQFISVEAKIEKNKKEVPILGKSGKGNKAAGWKGSGSATLHYISSDFREMMLEYVKTGKDCYFDIQVSNEDPTSAAGRQTTFLKHCNLDSIIIAKVDADTDTLTEDMDFTFDDVEMPETFTAIEGM